MVARTFSRWESSWRKRELTALIAREGSVPEDVRAAFVKQRSMEEALQFVIEADLLVGGAQPACGSKGDPPDSAGDNPGASGVGVGEIGDVAAEELVCALAAQGDSHVSDGHAREMPDRNGSGVGVGLIGVVGKLGNRFRCNGCGTKVEFMMVGRVTGRHLADVARFVEFAAIEGDREGLELGAGVLACIVKNRRRIDPSAEPDSNRNVGGEMLLDRLGQELVELRGRVFQGGKRGGDRVDLPASSGAKRSLRRAR